MTKNTKKIAVFRHKKREAELEKVAAMVQGFKQQTGVGLFPPTLKQTALFLRYIKAGDKAYNNLMLGIQKSLTYRQGKGVLGLQTDPVIENWKTSVGRQVGSLLNELGLR